MISKDNIHFIIEAWHKIRGNSIKRMAFLFVLAAIAAQFHIVQLVIAMIANRLFNEDVRISDTPAWLSLVFGLFAIFLIVVDHFSEQISKRLDQKTLSIKQYEEFQKLVKIGEDIIRRQKIMATNPGWENDPTIGVWEREGNLWRDTVRRHIFEKNLNKSKVLKELDYIMDINIHIFDEKFNRRNGTESGTIKSYLNHSLAIQSFLMKHG